MKNKTEDDALSFIKHEFGHFVVVDVALWLAKKINKSLEKMNNKEECKKIREYMKNVQLLIGENESQATLFGDLMYEGFVK